jgi:hypothetical protein
MTVGDLVKALDAFDDDVQIRIDGPGTKLWDIVNVGRDDDGTCIIEIV